MAQPTTSKFGKFRILLGNGAEPEVFTAPCGFTSKAFTLSKNLTEITIPDCDDPDAPFWIARDTESLSASITGEGLAAAESIQDWTDAAYSTDPVNAKVEIEFATGVLSFTGPFHIDSFNPSAEQGGRVQLSVSMQSDGQVTKLWTATP
ncbi:hypothetical protein G6N74_29445 [Mesorhizobium sp. CGMCC 1.15528]|uniref:Phage tail protein n=1 Tax=Mesorhizobium zhangyense TaxID=1776730 RepID=A0A7C9RBS0_9HYPH|nr:phage tail tube protein [Mesorhizobium zhangyense]NGN45181.1 hypothetical protein [Mesorhizobium zhangyense]